ncbi:MAG: hypothetical protein A2583_09920 [Bdellovibrionales bacterium RIFOXYD1_FULL_53_11]|nr:MAG: hypothetical protein A2583_09920 [Bdellovibrionales bacterium RIFOXYD1_FULL_53_11]
MSATGTAAGESVSYIRNTEVPAKILTPTPEGSGIEGLRWLDQKADIVFGPSDSPAWVRVRGSFKRKDWTLMTTMLKWKYVSSGPAAPDFSMYVPIKEQETKAVIIAIGPLGEIEKTTLTVKAPYWPMKPPRRLSLTPGIGFTYLIYREDPLGVSLQEGVLTAKFSVNYQLIPAKLELGGSIYGNVQPVLVVPSTVESARFMGINARAGYRLPMRWFDWRWTAYGGAYFWMMFTSGSKYGIQYISGPQLFFGGASTDPNIRRIGLYIKYAPLFESFTAVKFANFEGAVGGACQITRPGARYNVQGTLDVSWLQFTHSVGNKIRLMTVSLGAQVGW